MSRRKRQEMKEEIKSQFKHPGEKRRRKKLQTSPVDVQPSHHNTAMKMIGDLIGNAVILGSS